MTLTSRPAIRADLPALEPLVRAAIDVLQQGFLDAAQIRSSHAIMGIDTQLVDDGTYYIVFDEGALAGCGGWSRRATLYGGSHSPGRDTTPLDPTTDPARIRAMYTHPDHTRRGVGRLIIALSETAAMSEGFSAMELHSTLAGRPLYEACGYRAVERHEDASGGSPVPVIRMRKELVAHP